MLRRRRQLPSYRFHKASGQAVVTLSGQDFYLGRHGTRASQDAYDRVTSEWLAAGRMTAALVPERGLSIAELANAFRKSGAIPGSHEDAYKAVIRLLVGLYGETPADQFGPLALKVVREKMVQAGWKRYTVNQRVHNLRRIFKWGVENELLPPTVVQALTTVEALRAGKTTAPESEPVKPVALEHVEATLQHASPTIQAMIRLQLFTGARAGEICIMRTGDLDMSGKTWVYRPQHHKTQHHGKLREIAVGPKAQAVLKPFLLPNVSAFIFSPARADQDRRARRTAGRKTPPNQGNGVGSNKKSRPQKTPGEVYDTPTYRRAIYDACDRAFPAPPPVGRRPDESVAKWRARLTPAEQHQLREWRRQHRWHPHQIRHSFADQVRREFSLDHAQKALGHTHANVTDRYAQVALDKAIEVASAIG